MDVLVSQFIREMKIASGLNEQLIYSAWDKVSGASGYTVSKYIKNNILYCGISSSVVRNNLFFHRDVMVRKINEILLEDELFVRDDPKTGLLRGIILR